MKIKDIQNTVLSIIRGNFGEKIKLANDSPLSDAGIDSVGAIQLVIALEEEFNFEFEDEMLSYETLRSIDSISEYIFNCINKKEE